ARGAVDPDVASAMADGVRARCGADIGVATTGVAGPDPQDGMPVGTVHLAVAGPGAGRVQVESVLFTGDRNSIRRQSVSSALLLVSRVLDVGAGR
ncbi:MAG TPA: CinA family protein, partial [Phycicoccus elongatus]|nr:CinA family protein [Phycicoccus elongatus]